MRHLRNCCGSTGVRTLLRALHFSFASGSLLGCPAIFQWLTASLYSAFNSFHAGTLNFEGFCIPNIALPLLSIAFGINVNKSLSLFKYKCLLPILHTSLCHVKLTISKLMISDSQHVRMTSVHTTN